MPWSSAVRTLPSQGMRWQAIDERRARAMLSDGSTTLSIVFGFSADGLIETAFAEARARSVGDHIETTPWQVRVWNYAEREGVMIPLEGEVAWLLPTGPYPYWRGKLETISVEPVR
jgi:hypothetical protein